MRSMISSYSSLFRKLAPQIKLELLLVRDERKIRLVLPGKVIVREGLHLLQAACVEPSVEDEIRSERGLHRLQTNTP